MFFPRLWSGVVLALAFYLPYTGPTERSPSETPKRRLQVAIVGSIDNPDPQYNPYAFLQPDSVRQVLMELAEAPLPRPAIEERLAQTSTRLEDLLRLQILREDDGRVYLNFPLFTAADQQRIMRAADKYTTYLVEALLKQRPAIERALATYRPTSVDRSKVAFIVIGCLLLDLDALDLLAEHGYIVHRPEKPGGNRYVLNAEEVTDISLREIYWGCHTQQIGAVTLLTFGDHDAATVRNAFPDLLWRLGRDLRERIRNRYPGSYAGELYAVLRNALKVVPEQVIAVLLRLKQGPATPEEMQSDLSIEHPVLASVLNLLQSLHYLQSDGHNYHLIIPVLTEEDRKMYRTLRNIVRREILYWLERYHADLRRELAEITPYRHGVPEGETFNMLWHYFFGYTNRALARAGLLFDTYRNPPGFTGYVPALVMDLTGN